MSDFIKTQDDDGVATITWNCVDRPMNVMSEQGFSDLNALVDDCIADETISVSYTHLTLPTKRIV